MLKSGVSFKRSDSAIHEFCGVPPKGTSILSECDSLQLELNGFIKPSLVRAGVRCQGLESGSERGESDAGGPGHVSDEP